VSGERWERLQELFHRALALAPGERLALLERECAVDASLRAEVERLLAAHDRAGGFIDRPAAAGLGEGDPGDTAWLPGGRVGAYRLVRALGRGGMGAVYLAERDEGGFTQLVAIKLIKRGMDTDRVLARFRAERQILASLDHPNIARLLDGGSTGDGLPYFAMEYIEGQPIDAFADSRGLGVDDRLRLFLPVCEAVAYAHAQGVVHRDIKPLNTLVTTAGVPKLLDFGIAKVLHDDPDEQTSTVTGLRLLTPDYASPEQIEGLHASVASDVYSLGVILYELLTGRSPYRVPSRTPQEIAAAVRTTEPDRPSTAVSRPGDHSGHLRDRGDRGHTGPASGATAARQLSRRLRGDLDTIVLTALRKEPARRYASVAALADDIRRHLDGRPVLARPDRPAYRAGKFVRRHRTTVLATGLAVVGAVILTAAFLRTRPGLAGGDPTLIAQHSLAPRDRILVADFTDRTGDAALTAAVTEAFRIDLGQSPVVRVLSSWQVRESLERMTQAPDLALDDSLARELAIREGVKAIVTGSLARVAGSYTVNVELVATQGGEALASVRETATDSTRLILAVDRASKALRRRIGESLRELERTPGLDQVTTRSLPALREYTEAQRLVRQGHRTAAIARFQAAIAADTGFASAYLGLGMAYASIGDNGRAFSAGDHAAANASRLPFLERAFLLASRAYGGADYPTAIRIYGEVVARYPDNVPALNNLALVYRDSRQFAQAESLLLQAAALDSTIANLYFGIHGAQVLGGRFDRARETLATIARRFPDHPILLTETMQDAAAQQDWPRAEQAARDQIERMGQDTLQLVDPYEALAGIAMTRGRLAEAERLWDRHLLLSRAGGAMGRHLFGAIQLGWLTLRWRGDTSRAIALVDSVLRVLPLDSLLPADRRYDELARFYLAAGRPRQARALLDGATTNDSLARTPPSERRWTLGVLAAAGGRSAEALEALGDAAATHLCTNCVLPDLGRALEAAGRWQAVAGAYQDYLTTPWLWRYEPDAVELAWTMRRLGEVRERSGDRNGAIEAYGQLLALWRDADPELRPALDSVRGRVRALQGPP
jgi:serine/threonine protein kinase/tetratricopeptide (TPR) repeat protein